MEWGPLMQYCWISRPGEMKKYCIPKIQERGYHMNAFATKPNVPYVAKSELKRTPASVDNKKMVEYMDSHNFSFSICKDSGELRSTITKK